MKSSSRHNEIHRLVGLLVRTRMPRDSTPCTKMHPKQGQEGVWVLDMLCRSLQGFKTHGLKIAWKRERMQTIEN